jgi:hypothetical protein
MNERMNGMDKWKNRACSCCKIVLPLAMASYPDKSYKNNVYFALPLTERDKLCMDDVPCYCYDANTVWQLNI